MKKSLLISTIFLTTVLFIAKYSDAQTKIFPQNLLKHIVIITFKQGTSPDSIKAVDKAFTSLSKIALVKEFEWGVDISGQSKLERHSYVLSFASSNDIKVYKKTPQHDELARVADPIVKDVIEVDYWP